MGTLTVESDNICCNKVLLENENMKKKLTRFPRRVSISMQLYDILRSSAFWDIYVCVDRVD